MRNTTLEFKHEITLQYNYLRECGIIVFHADSNQHINQYPFWGKLILKALAEVGITKIRNCKQLSIYDKRRFIVKTF